jgi:hypothetical protein
MIMTTDQLKIELHIRNMLNKISEINSRKCRLPLGLNGASHEFDIFEEKKIIGGISTSPWRNKTSTINTGGQDRVSTEILWLSLWEGPEKRIIILTDCEMAERIYKKFRGCLFKHPIEIFHFNTTNEQFVRKGVLYNNDTFFHTT